MWDGSMGLWYLDYEPLVLKIMARDYGMWEDRWAQGPTLLGPKARRIKDE